MALIRQKELTIDGSMVLRGLTELEEQAIANSKNTLPDLTANHIYVMTKVGRSNGDGSLSDPYFIDDFAAIDYTGMENPVVHIVAADMTGDKDVLVKFTGLTNSDILYFDLSLAKHRYRVNLNIDYATKDTSWTNARIRVYNGTDNVNIASISSLTGQFIFQIYTSTLNSVVVPTNTRLFVFNSYIDQLSGYVMDQLYNSSFSSVSGVGMTFINSTVVNITLSSTSLNSLILYNSININAYTSQSDSVNGLFYNSRVVLPNNRTIPLPSTIINSTINCSGTTASCYFKGSSDNIVVNSYLTIDSGNVEIKTGTVSFINSSVTGGIDYSLYHNTADGSNVKVISRGSKFLNTDRNPNFINLSNAVFDYDADTVFNHDRSTYTYVDAPYNKDLSVQAENVDDSQTFTNITPSNTTQKAINAAIDTALANTGGSINVPHIQANHIYVICETASVNTDTARDGTMEHPLCLDDLPTFDYGTYYAPYIHFISSDYQASSLTNTNAVISMLSFDASGGKTVYLDFGLVNDYLTVTLNMNNLAGPGAVINIVNGNGKIDVVKSGNTNYRFGVNVYNCSLGKVNIFVSSTAANIMLTLFNAYTDTAEARSVTLYSSVVNSANAKFLTLYNSTVSNATISQPNDNTLKLYDSVIANRIIQAAPAIPFYGEWINSKVSADADIKLPPVVRGCQVDTSNSSAVIMVTTIGGTTIEDSTLVTNQYVQIQNDNTVLNLVNTTIKSGSEWALILADLTWQNCKIYSTGSKFMSISNTDLNKVNLRDSKFYFDSTTSFADKWLGSQYVVGPDFGRDDPQYALSSDRVVDHQQFGYINPMNSNGDVDWSQTAINHAIDDAFYGVGGQDPLGLYYIDFATTIPTAKATGAYKLPFASFTALMTHLSGNYGALTNTHIYLMNAKNTSVVFPDNLSGVIFEELTTGNSVANASGITLEFGANMEGCTFRNMHIRAIQCNDDDGGNFVFENCVFDAAPFTHTSQFNGGKFFNCRMQGLEVRSGSVNHSDYYFDSCEIYGGFALDDNAGVACSLHLNNCSFKDFGGIIHLKVEAGESNIKFTNCNFNMSYVEIEGDTIDAPIKFENCNGFTITKLKGLFNLSIDNCVLETDSPYAIEDGGELIEDESLLCISNSIARELNNPNVPLPININNYTNADLVSFVYDEKASNGSFMRDNSKNYLSTSQIRNLNSLSNLGLPAKSTQQAINEKINLLIGASGSGTSGSHRGTVFNTFATQNIDYYEITDLTLDAFGTGYAAKDIAFINIDEQKSTNSGVWTLMNAWIVIDSVDPSTGEVLTYSISSNGLFTAEVAAAGNLLYPVSTISDGNGTGLTINYIAFSTIADGERLLLSGIPNPVNGDTAIVLYDEVHGGATWEWEYGDANGDGTSNWIPVKQLNTADQYVTQYKDEHIHGAKTFSTIPFVDSSSLVAAYQRTAPDRLIAGRNIGYRTTVTNSIGSTLVNMSLDPMTSGNIDKILPTGEILYITNYQGSVESYGRYDIYRTCMQVNTSFTWTEAYTTIAGITCSQADWNSRKYVAVRGDYINAYSSSATPTTNAMESSPVAVRFNWDETNSRIVFQIRNRYWAFASVTNRDMIILEYGVKRTS